MEARADLNAQAWVSTPRAGLPRSMTVSAMIGDALLAFEEYNSSDYYKARWTGDSHRYLQPARTVEQWAANWEREVRPYVKMQKAVGLLERGWPLEPVCPSNFASFPSWFRVQVRCTLLCLRSSTSLPNDLIVQEILPKLSCISLWDAPYMRPRAPPLPPEVVDEAISSSGTQAPTEDKDSWFQSYRKRIRREKRMRGELGICEFE